MFTENGNASDKSIAAFEHKIGFQLPSDYRAFLKSTNGGLCKDAIIRSQRPGELLIDYLFGLDGKEELNLQFWHDEFRGEIPEKSIIIGSDAGGGFILLCLEEGLEGIYYYDHSYSFPTSSDEENTYFMYPDFSGLFAEIHKC